MGNSCSEGVGRKRQGTKFRWADPYNLCMSDVDLTVHGGGPVGLAMALSMARLGRPVRLVSSAPPSPTSASSLHAGADLRTYALSADSVALLQALKVWEALPADAKTPVHDMVVYGDERSESSALPATLRFSAWQQALSELNWIVDAAALDEALSRAAQFSPHLSVVSADSPLASKDVALRVFADGKDSDARRALGVAVDRQDYGHWAVGARLRSDRPHAGTARQWFGSPEVLALLPFDRPLAAQSYGLVWSVPQARAQALLALPDSAFEAALAAATEGRAGALTLEGERAAWPLRVQRAQTWCGPGWVLLGDAAHVVHPLAGQGLNLGLADVASLSRVLAQAESWRSLGDEKLLRRHVRQRWIATEAMMGLTDGLWHLFAAEHPLARQARNQGLRLLEQISPLKRWLVRQATHS